MMFHQLGWIHRNQWGFTVIELLIAIAISGIIAGATTTAIFQTFDGSTRSNNHMIAVRQVQNAGYWISRDGQMAQSVLMTPASNFPLTFIWTDWDNANTYQVTYTLLADNKLQRQRTAVSLGLDETSIVAQFIEAMNTKCGLAGGGIFLLRDQSDSVIITGGAEADGGTIINTTGVMTVAVDDGAIYDSDTGAWTTPAGGGTLKVNNTPGVITEGTWTSTTNSATINVSHDTDGDVTVTGRVFVFTVTAVVGSGSQEASETRVYEVVHRPGL